MKFSFVVAVLVSEFLVHVVLREIQAGFQDEPDIVIGFPALVAHLWSRRFRALGRKYVVM